MQSKRMPDTQQLWPVLLQVVVLQRVHQTTRTPPAADPADAQKTKATTASQRLSVRDPLQGTAAASEWQTSCLAPRSCPLGSDVARALAWVAECNRGGVQQSLWQLAALTRHADFNFR